MRDERTPDEAWAIVELKKHLYRTDPGWKEDEKITDKPDLVLEKKGIRVSCELSTVGLKEWYQWKNDPRMKLDTDELDSFIVPREPNIWLRNVINSKNPKIQSYHDNSNSAEAWLVVHGSLMSPYDLFVLDKEYDIPLLQSTSKSTKHDFTRIYVVSSSANTVVQVYPPDPSIKPMLKLRQGTLKQLELRSVQLDCSGGGRVEVKLGQEYKPHREIILQPLGIYI